MKGAARIASVRIAAAGKTTSNDDLALVSLAPCPVADLDRWREIDPLCRRTLTAWLWLIYKGDSGRR